MKRQNPLLIIITIASIMICGAIVAASITAFPISPVFAAAGGETGPNATQGQCVSEFHDDEICKPTEGAWNSQGQCIKYDSECPKDVAPPGNPNDNHNNNNNG
jgi:hypothetical protein